MKKLATFLSLLAIVLSAFAFGNANTASATIQEACNNQTTYIVTPENDGDSNTQTEPINDIRVSIDIQDFSSDDDRRVVVTPNSGYQLISVGVDYTGNDDNDATPSVGTGFATITFDAPNNQDIEHVTVTVKKYCATSSPTATATATATPSNVTICHATGSAQNPYNTLHVSSNAISGHFENNGTPKDGHEDDLLLQGTVECPGGSTPTASPTATATASATPTATPSETVVPTPTATPTPLVCTGTQHLNADGSRCVDFELGGGPSNGGSAQGQVLGASTMAGTGNFAETLYQAIMGLGAIFTAKGLKKSKKASK